jgi:hypothetical protein
LLLLPFLGCTETSPFEASHDDAGFNHADEPSNAADASLGPSDAGALLVDAHVTLEDASAERDAGAAHDDAGAAHDDAGTAYDAGPPPYDAEVPEYDAGSGAHDAGTNFDAGACQHACEPEDAGHAQEPKDAGHAHVLALPLVLDDWYFTRNGYIGDGTLGGIVDDTHCPVRAGKKRGKCHHITWTPKDNGYGGGWWLYPEANMGAEPGLAIPQGAKAVRFYAWGAHGGEAAEFGVGMIGADGFKRVLPEVVLENTPTEYTLDLTGANYSDVIGGFAFLLGGSKAPVTIFLDDIRWE